MKQVLCKEKKSAHVLFDALKFDAGGPIFDLVTMRVLVNVL